MAATTREQVMAALLAQLSPLANFNTVQRVDLPWSALGDIQQPALILIEGVERHERPLSGPAKRTLRVAAIVYARNDGESTAGDTILNPLIEAVETALAPSPMTALNTLGGQVAHCWIEGDLERDPGDTGNQAFAIIPINILVP